MASQAPAGAGRRLELDLLLRDAARPAEEQKRQRRADPGEESAGEEGGLEALRQRDERVGAVVRRQVVLGAGDGNRRDDGDAERGAELERGVAEARREPGLTLGDARERRDRDGDEGEADAGAVDDDAEEDVAEVAAADGGLR